MKGRGQADLPHDLPDRLGELHDAIRATCLRSRQGGAEARGFQGGDTLYELDLCVEPVLLDWASELARRDPLVLVAEGIDSDEAGREGMAVFPAGTPPAAARYWVIVDPIDGTRGVMVDKRSAWCLTAVAPGGESRPRLSDLVFAMQSEIPTAKQSFFDHLWIWRGGSLHAQRRALDGSEGRPLRLRPSQADGLEHGFASIASFFPGTKRESADLLEEIVAHSVGGRPGFAPVFDDQYISTAGQLYELAAGHDRLNADLRPLFWRLRGEAPGLSCHPYDLCCAMLAEAAGVILTDGLGRRLDGPLDVESPMSWIGYANRRIERLVAPLIADWLARHGLTAGDGA